MRTSPPRLFFSVLIAVAEVIKLVSLLTQLLTRTCSFFRVANAPRGEHSLAHSSHFLWVRENQSRVRIKIWVNYQIYTNFEWFSTVAGLLQRYRQPCILASKPVFASVFLPRLVGILSEDFPSCQSGRDCQCVNTVSSKISCHFLLSHCHTYNVFSHTFISISEAKANSFIFSKKKSGGLYSVFGH